MGQDKRDRKVSHNVEGMASKTKHKLPACVALTDESENEAAAKAAIVIGRRVRLEAGQRSHMLHDLSHMEGTAQLPAHLSPEDVQLWQAASLVRCEPSTEQLVTIVKVADALGDATCATWLATLARRVCAAKWTDPTISEDMLCTLLPLPTALHHRLFAECLCTTPLDTLLSDIPSVLHPPLITAAAAAATPAGLTAPARTLRTFISILPHVQFPFPGLLSLTLPLSPCLTALDPPSAALLGHAASAHPCLTSLLLDAVPLSPAALCQLRASLTPNALPNLSTFSVAAAVHPNGCAELALCLGRLSMLTALTVTTVHNNPPVPTPPLSISPYIRAASSPAQLAHLPCLKLCERRAPDGAPKAIQSSSLPAFQPSSCCDLLLPLLDAAKLTAIHITSDVAASPLPAFAASLMHFSSLEQLVIDADISDSLSVYAGAPALLAKHQPGGPSAVLPALRSLTITSVSHTAPLRMGAAIAQHVQESLTCVILSHKHAEGTVRNSNVAPLEDAKPAWAAFLEVLQCCQALKQLKVATLASPHGPAEAKAWNEGLRDALSRLPLLTLLTLQVACKSCNPGARCTLSGECLAASLRTMQELRSLTIHSTHGVLEVTAPERLLAVLPQLGRLQALGLCFQGVDRRQLVDLLPQLPALANMHVMEPVLGQTDAERAELCSARAGLTVKGIPA